jgi:hypothetical protein
MRAAGRARERRPTATSAGSPLDEQVSGRELPRHFSGGSGTVSTGTFEVRTTRSAVLPIKK